MGMCPMALRPVPAAFQARTAVSSKSSFNSCARWIRLASSGLTPASLSWRRSSLFTHAPGLGRPGRDLLNQFLAPRHPFGEPPPQQHEIHLTLLLAAVMEGAETRARLGHHVQRQPGAIALAVAVPVFQLVFAQALNGLDEAIGHGVQQLGAQRFYSFIKQRQIYGTFGQQFLALLALLSGFRFADQQPAVFINHAIGNHQWIRYPLSVHLERWNNLGQASKPVEAVRTPGLTQRAAAHGPLHAHK